MDIVFEKTLCFTGHRPKRLGSYEFRDECNMRILRKLKALIIRYIERRGVTTFITGMAIGIDIWAARIILSLKEKYPHIKLVAAVPCVNQEQRWNRQDQLIYHQILEQADYVHMVSDKPYTSWCMDERDKWMVDMSTFVIGVFDGKKKGGTWKTLNYAHKRQRRVACLHPDTLEIELK